MIPFSPEELEVRFPDSRGQLIIMARAQITWSRGRPAREVIKAAWP